MKQNVILNKIHEEVKRLVYVNSDAKYFVSQTWNIACNNVASNLRAEGLKDSAKEAEKWIKKRYER